MKTAFILVPSAIALNPDKTYNFKNYPPQWEVAPPNNDFMDQYDFSKVPNYTIAQPYHSKGSVLCNLWNNNTCSWGCTHCVKGDVIECINKKDWGLSYDDGINDLIQDRHLQH